MFGEVAQMRSRVVVSSGGFGPPGRGFESRLRYFQGLRYPGILLFKPGWGFCLFPPTQAMGLIILVLSGSDRVKEEERGKREPQLKGAW